jgi:hypothetical protein
METFGRYQLQDTLGQGGMGVVYRAFDTVLERVVALKLILTPDALDPEMRERFFREARAAGQLSHKNIVTIYDLGEEGGRPYLAMEYLAGEDLQRRLGRPERMSLGHKVDLAIEVCSAVEYAHSHGVVHRDLKPANIFITESGNAKILDFGLARLMTSQLTQSNMLMGTLNYMAPEQVRGERADQRSDVFSVGVVLYELLGGRKAFEGDSVANTLYKILEEVPEPLWRIDPALPRELVAIVERALAKPRDERYPDMGEVRRDLEAYRQVLHASGPITPMRVPLSAPLISRGGRLEPTAGSGETTISASAAPRDASPARAAHQARGSGRTMAIGAGVMMAAAVAAVGLFAVRSRETPPPPVAPTTATRADDPVALQLQRAQQALDARQHAEALKSADAVLLAAPQNAEALRIRDAARHGAVADAVLRAARHLQNGATGDAIQAAGEALALAPDNADARRILEQAGTRTSGPDAEAARRRMAEQRASAQTAGASTLAASAFRSASRAAQDADRLYRAHRFADAATRYYEASGLYRSAEVVAKTRAPSADVAATTPSPTLVPHTDPPVVSTPAPSPVPAPTPAPDSPANVPATAPMSPAAPNMPPRSTPRPGPPPDARPPSAEEGIHELVGRYKDALESRSFDQLKRLWPSLSGTAESAMHQEFQHATRISVEIADPLISVSGSSGKVSFIRKYSLITVEGQRLQSTTQVVMDVRRTGNGWIIDGIRFTPR